MAGTFYQPPLVLIDTETLSTLPKRELVAGFEMVKQSLVANKSLFNSTTQLLAQAQNDRGVIHTCGVRSADCCALVDSRHRSPTTNAKLRADGYQVASNSEFWPHNGTRHRGDYSIKCFVMVKLGYGILVAGRFQNLGLLSDVELESFARCGSSLWSATKGRRSRHKQNHPRIGTIQEKRCRSDQLGIA
jgi:hypothetical protein